MSLKSILISLILVITCQFSIAQDIIVQDDNFKKVPLKAPVKTVVTTTPAQAKLLEALGASDRLVGVSSFTTVTGKTPPNIGDAHNLKIAEIIKLKPDLVILGSAHYNHNAEKKLEKANIKVLLFSDLNIGSLASHIETLATALGLNNKGTELGMAITSKIKVLKEKYSKDSTLLVAPIIQWTPNIRTINNESYLNDILTICGAQNVYADKKEMAPIIHDATIKASHAKEIIYFTGSKNNESIPKSYAGLPVITIKSDALIQLSPATIDAIPKVCKLLREKLLTQTR
ncbi:MAG: hypothetical protein COB66_05540 [Coxiella sp. (in: Bacteria)]|nr:MAG: hypothetical protein COB66_05540 [Coxiella sp. (in: g-proteobacteria)]